MQDAQELHQHMRCGYRDRRAIMDVVKHKAVFSYVSDQETLFFRLKYNQIHVSKPNSQKKAALLYIKGLFPFIIAAYQSH